MQKNLRQLTCLGLMWSDSRIYLGIVEDFPLSKLVHLGGRPKK
jgi:hypothetical protein